MKNNSVYEHENMDIFFAGKNYFIVLQLFGLNSNKRNCAVQTYQKNHDATYPQRNIIKF